MAIETKEDKKEFIENFLNSIKEQIFKGIESGAIPEEWDGIELRELVKDIAVDETFYFNGKKRQKRYKDY